MEIQKRDVIENMPSNFKYRRLHDPISCLGFEIWNGSLHTPKFVAVA